MKLERVKSSDNRIAPNADHPMTWTEYHSSADINAYLDYLLATYPDLVLIDLEFSKSQTHKMTETIILCSSKISSGHMLILCYFGAKKKVSFLSNIV